MSEHHAPAATTRTPRVAEPPVEGEFVQFRVAVGRNDKADPKWLVPLICRLGGVTKREIGVIRVGDTETRFEIAAAAASRFVACAEGADTDEPRISPSSPPPDGGPVRPRTPYAGGPPRRAASTRRRPS